MIIKPITIRLVAYGQKANIAALRTRSADLLKEEHGRVDAACFVDRPAADAHAEIMEKRLETEVVLKKPSASKDGIVITLPEVNERFANEWLQELPIAKTCVVFATWTSHREGMNWQMLIADGGRWSESRAWDSGQKT